MRDLRPPNRDIEFPASSLADMAFLLMVFFMITTLIAAARGFHFILPSAESKAALVERQEVVIVHLADDASITADGQALAEDSLQAFLEERQAGGGISSVILEVSRACPYGGFARAANRIRLAGFERFAIKGVE